MVLLATGGEGARNLIDRIDLEDEDQYLFAFMYYVAIGDKSNAVNFAILSIKRDIDNIFMAIIDGTTKINADREAQSITHLKEQIDALVDVAVRSLKQMSS